MDDSGLEALDAPPLVLIAGMHRSGTSLLATTLEAMGAYLGRDEDKMEAAPSNPHGHGELFAVARLNDEVLRACDAHWAAPRPIEPSRLEIHARGTLGDRARALLARELDGVALVKDPRFCLTLPFWRAVFDGGRELCLLIPWRHPREVALSLEARNKLPAGYGRRLWFWYHQRLADTSLDLDRLVLPHRGLVEHPSETLAAVRTWLAERDVGLDLPTVSTASIVPESIHHHSDDPLADAESAVLRALTDGDPMGTQVGDLELPDDYLGAVAAYANERDRFRFELRERRRRR